MSYLDLVEYDYYKKREIMKTFLKVIKTIFQVLTIVTPLIRGIIDTLEKNGLKKKKQ